MQLKRCSPFYPLSFNTQKSYSHYQHYLDFLKNAELPDSKFAENIETDKTNGTTYIRLNENEYFLIGDNWGRTTDSLTNGPVKQKEIIGKVELIVDVENNNPFVTTWHFLKKIFTA